MGRPSKLTEKQWLQVERRQLAGESMRKLADEYGVSEAAIRKRVSTQSKQIKIVANQIIETEQALANLPLSAQLCAVSLADQLRSISMHLGHAANYGAMTAHKLSGLANAKAKLLDESVDVDSDEGLAKLRGIAALTRLSNDSAQIGVDLLKANKEAIDSMNRDEPEESDKSNIHTMSADAITLLGQVRGT
jgi:hypothetical protein